ncbi:MAG: ABC transporter permease [Alphaproteobacteria bacterium]
MAERDGALTVSASGRWTVRHIAEVDEALRGIAANGRRAVLDLSGIDRLDTAGAWMIERIRRRLSEEGMKVDLSGARPDHESLLRQVSVAYAPCDIVPAEENPYLALLRRIGRSVESSGREAVALFGFAGLVLTALVRSVIHLRLRPTSLVYHMEQAGLNAVPIICLMAFLVGSVIAFLGASILEDYGVESLVINMLSYSILREFGVFLTAIMVAGRSGSAFTAQIGSMKGREEIDAMRTLGLDPVELLVVPRILALLIVVPLLTFLADIAGLVGGGLASWAALDVSPTYFLSRLRELIITWPGDFWAGLIKAPVFGFLVGLIGCYQGFQVEGSAESVGNRTTLSVVEAIFVVIVFDAAFAAYFMIIDF